MPNESTSKEASETRKYFIEAVPFPSDIFPKTIESYLKKTATILQVDYATVALTCLGLCAVALGGKKKIQLGDWIEKSIIWLVMVGRSGVGKTALLNHAGLAEIQAWQSEQIQNYRNAESDYEERLRQWESCDREERKEQFPNGKPIEPETASQCFTNLTTIESILALNDRHSEGVSCVADEICSILDSQNQYKKGIGNDQAVMLETWTGHGITNNLVNKIRFIPDPFCCLIGGIQPELLEKIINPKNMQDGFASRILFSFIEEPEKILHWREKKELEKTVTPEEKEAFHGLFTRFIQHRGESITYELTAQAEDYLRELHYQLDKDARSAEHDLFSSTRKLKTYTMRIALLLHCINQNESAIDDQTIYRTDCIIQYLKHNTEKSFQVALQKQEEKNRMLIIEKIKLSEEPPTKKIICQRLKRQIEYKNCGKLIDLMIAENTIKEQKSNGRSTFLYIECVNP